MSLTLVKAQSLIAAAMKAAGEQSVPAAVVVVDRGGRVLASARSETVGYINLAIAERKATASVNFGAPTGAVLDMIKGDAVLLASVMGETSLSLLPGGMPITIDGQLTGALGVAGGHYSQDHAIAESAMSALQH